MLVSISFHRLMGAIVFSAGAFCQSPPPVSFEVQTLAGSTADGDGGPAQLAVFGGISSIAIDQKGNLYVSERKYHRVRRISPDGVVVTVAGTGQAGRGPDAGIGPRIALDLPSCIAVNGAGDLFVADTGNAVVRKLSLNGEMTTVAGGGKIPADAGGEGSYATVLSLRSPRGLLPDSQGGLFVSDTEANRVYYIDPRGILTTVAGSGINVGSGAQVAYSTPINAPMGLAHDPQGGIIIAESGASRYRRVFKGFISTFYSGFEDLSPGFRPSDVLFDTQSGSAFFVDGSVGAVVQRLETGGVKLVSSSVRAMAVDRFGTLLFATDSNIYRHNGPSVAGRSAEEGTLGQTGNEKAIETRLSTPVSVVRLPDLAFLVAEEGANRIRRIGPDGMITTYAGNGQAGFCGDGGPAALACLNGPRGLAIDRWGNVFIADTGNHAVRVVTPDGFIYTVAGNGRSGTDTAVGPAGRAVLDRPSGVAISKTGELLIADTGNRVIRRLGVSGLLFTLDHAPVWRSMAGPTTVCVAPDGTIVVADPGSRRVISETSDGIVRSIEDSRLLAPEAVGVDLAGRIWIADSASHSILVFDGVQLTRVAGTGIAGYSGDRGLANSAQFNAPRGLLIENETVLVVDSLNSRLRLLLPK